MNDDEFWQVIYLIAVFRGDKNARQKADKAVADINKSLGGEK